MSSKSKTKKKPALVVDDTVEEKPTEQQQSPDQYIAAALKGDIELIGIEAKVVNNLRGQREKQLQLRAEIQRLSDDLRRAQDLLQQLGGRIDENTRLLLEAESERRGHGAITKD